MLFKSSLPNLSSVPDHRRTWHFHETNSCPLLPLCVVATAKRGSFWRLDIHAKRKRNVTALPGPSGVEKSGVDFGLCVLVGTLRCSARPSGSRRCRRDTVLLGHSPLSCARCSTARSHAVDPPFPPAVPSRVNRRRHKRLRGRRIEAPKFIQIVGSVSSNHTSPDIKSNTSELRENTPCRARCLCVATFFAQFHIQLW